MKTPNIIAHRGGRKWAPENTLAAFQASLEFGAYGIELDIQRCATGELVVIHDEDVARTTNGVGLVKDCSLAELKRLSAGLWFSKEFQDQRIPLLSEVLDLINGQLIINIELKNAPVDYPGIEDDLIATLENYIHLDTLIISSFDHKLLYALHQKAPNLNIAILGASVFLNLKELSGCLGAKYFHPSFDCVRQDVLLESHAAGLQVNTWTCNNTRDWSRGVKLGVDGIVTDDPAGLREFLSQAATGVVFPR